MTALFFTLIIIACAVLGFFVLIQNPKGGGLAGSLSGVGTQLMGAKQSTDIVEKGTWITAAAVLVFTLLSFVLRPTDTTNSNKSKAEQLKLNVQAPTPQPQAPAAPAQQQPAAQPQQAPAQQGQPAPATK